MLEKSLSFLKLLKENNYKEWFHENKPLYEDAKKEFELFVKQLIQEVSLIDKEIGYPEPKDCIFRIFRDIRFSTDKTPYKTNFGAYMAKGGRKSEYGGYYFHLEPGTPLLAGGIWLPQPDILKAVREEIYHNTDEILAIMADKDFKKHFGGDFDQEYLLKTAPKDYPKDWPYIGLLKQKSFTVSKILSEEAILGPNLMDEVRVAFKAMLPMNKFFNRVIEDVRS